MARRPAIPVDTRNGVGTVAFTLSGQPDTLSLVDNGDGSAEIVGTISAGEAATSPYTTTVTATDDTDETDSESFTITVVTVLALDAIDDQEFTEEAEITSVEVSVTSGTGDSPYVLSVSGLPSGLTFTDDGDGTGSISGTPAVGTEASSPYTVTITALDGAGQEDTETFDVTIAAASSAATAYFPGNGSTAHWRTADTATNSVGGDIDIRVDVAMDDWDVQDALVGKVSTTSNRAYYFITNFTGTGVLTFGWDDGSVTERSSIEHGFTAGSRHQVRVTLDVDNGSSQHEVKFWTRDISEGLPLTDDTGWVQLGTTQTLSGTTSIRDTTASLEIGRFFGTGHVAGDVYEALVLDGINGTVASHFDPTNDYGGSSGAGDPFTDSDTSATWNAIGAATIVIP